MNFIQNFDMTITHFLQNNVTNGFLNSIMPIITLLGKDALIWFVIAICLLFNKKYRIIGILTIAVIGFDFIIGSVIIKHLVHRPRPFMIDSSIHLITKAPHGYSFPSGHSGGSFAAATMLGFYFKKYKPYLFGLATLIAFSRVYLAAHFLTDVVCGAILGIVIAYAVNYIFKNYIATYFKATKH